MFEATNAEIWSCKTTKVNSSQYQLRDHEQQERSYSQTLSTSAKTTWKLQAGWYDKIKMKYKINIVLM